MWRVPAGAYPAFRTLLASAALCGIAGAVSAADAYPVRAIRLIVPFGSGGAADIIARLLGAHLSESLGKSVVVDNRPGGGTVLGTDILAHATPDGYAIGLLATAFALNVGLLDKLPYDTSRDFEPITLAVDTPLICVVPTSLPVKSLRDLIAQAKARPNGIAYGTSGQGSSGHLAVELLSYRAGIRLLHVPYRGAGQALVDLIAGQVQLVCTSTLPALPLVRSGQLRALAVTTAERTRAAPEVPTVAEAAALPGYRASTWYGMYAPAHVAQPIIATLYRVTVQALKLPSVVEQLAAQGGDPVAGTPEELRKFVQNEIDVWSKLIKQAGIKPSN